MIYARPALHQEAERGRDCWEGADRTGEDVRQVCEAILPDEEIERLWRQWGGSERQRKLPLGMLVRAMVMAAGTPGGAYQADILRSYVEVEVPRVARSAFSRWLDAPREPCMTALADRALAYARAPPLALTGMLGEVKDWSSVDSTTVQVRNALQAEFPGPGADAALKGHTVLSGGCGAPVHDHVRPAREPDRRPLQLDASWQGCGLLADLASASLARRRACQAHRVRCVIRLKDTWQPTVDSSARGHVTRELCPGTDLDGLLDEELLPRDGRAIDAAGRVGSPKDPRQLRLVGVHTPKGDGFCRTNLPPRTGPRPVADRYRIRWAVELRIRWDNSVHRLDPIDAERPCSVKTRLHASRIAAMIAALLAHTHHVGTRPPREDAPRTEAPLPPRRLALQLAVSCQAMAQAFARTGKAAKRRWQQSADVLTHAGRDPTWRRRPSIVDPLRGWKRQPGVRTQVSRDKLKAAA